jgi:hypothetical protein
MLSNIGFVKTALSPELLQRASNKAISVSNQLTSNVEVLNSMARNSGKNQDKIIKAIKDTAQLARKKNSQSIKFLTGALKIR